MYNVLSLIYRPLSYPFRSLLKYLIVFICKYIQNRVPTKNTESNLIADERGLHHLGHVVVWIIYTYTVIVLGPHYPTLQVLENKLQMNSILAEP